LINKCGNKLKHENEAEGPRGAMALSLGFVFKFISTFNSQNPFYACVDEGCSASLTIAREKQT
jgi:hypothetical protein